MIPEEGNREDFKRATLAALPAIPRYREKRWLDYPVTKWTSVYGVAFGVMQLIMLLVELAYGTTTWASLMRIPAALVEFGFVWLLVSSLRRSERIRAAVFEELRQYQKMAVETDAWFLVDNIEQQMANIIRRRSCNLITDWRVHRRNKRHVDSRQCPCCMQISYGLRTQEEGAWFTQTIYTFLEVCPFCGWKD